MRRIIYYFILVFCTLMYTSPSYAAITLLHEFAGGGSDGSSPQQSLIESSGVLYGMTYQGGDSDMGTIFKMNVDGSGFTLLHEFAGGGSDLANPEGDLILYSGVLYGLGTGGGDSNKGGVFKINPDGSGFSLLREFAGGANDGDFPQGSLIQSGILYGMTKSGGDSDKGTIFKMNVDGTGFTLLHEFAGGGSDGDGPIADLTLSGSYLYGMTPDGGDAGVGTIFKINIDGSGFALLHEFADDSVDGRDPDGSLIVSGTTLYGMTNSGGVGSSGTIFKINTDGTGMTILRNFAGDTSDGYNPDGALTLVNSTLYGMAAYGGSSDSGVVFKMDTDGTNYSLVHEFTDTTSDGGFPFASLAATSTKLYGMTYEGGDTDKGVIFSYALPVSPTATPTSTPTPTATSTSSSNNTTESSAQTQETYQIPQLNNQSNGGGIFIPVRDSNTNDQRVFAIIQPQTFNFNAFLSSSKIEPNDISTVSTTNTKTKPNYVVAGGKNGIIGIKSNNKVAWQVSNIQQIWYKTYPPKNTQVNPAKIVPDLQNKPSIITLSYTDQDLIPPGNPKKKFNNKTLKLAHSVDGITWKVLPSSVVDTRNKTVAAIDKVGGYYMIVGH